MSNSNQPWLLLIIVSYLLCPLYSIQSTPITPTQKTRRSSHEPCAHKSIAELIRTSPVILRALGAHIFTEDDLNEIAAAELQQAQASDKANSEVKWQNVQNNFLTSALTLDATVTPSTETTTTTTTARSSSSSSTNSRSGNMKSASSYDGNSMSVSEALTTSTKMIAKSILITLTPKTIYKGASLLKMIPGAESAARSSWSGSSSSSNSGTSSGAGGGGVGGGGSNTAESAYLYEGQLNATLEPLNCFDSNLLKILPTELIAFGKLITVQQQQQQQQHQQYQSTEQQQQQQNDFLHISINGLHRWSPEFENHIWKHLGWDNWSDFTLCSVTCGKGVQQRFRRCLLDNPMVNLNMNLNLNAVNDDVDNADVVHNVDDVEDDDHDVDEDVNKEKSKITEELKQQHWYEKTIYTVGGMETIIATTSPIIANDFSNKINDRSDSDAAAYSSNMLHKSNIMSKLLTADANALKQQQHQKPAQQWSAVSNNKNPNDDDVGVAVGDTLVADAAASYRMNDNDDSGGTNEVMRIFEQRNFNADNVEMDSKNERYQNNEKSVKMHRQHKRRKSRKHYSTMFCEGYNIEQRNCNIFECSDDISDLLKFYKKLPAPEESNAAAAAAMATTSNDISASAATTSATVGYAAAEMTSTATAASSSNANTFSAAAVTSSSTPENMGYIHSWRSALNFTLMVTLRVKQNSTKTTATIFSIRNATHNLYLESCKDGLRLYLERDKSTEMLPVKFNLYDYHWHQVAISIQNGDFISIYVDCSWTNSFIVSKRLYSLPLDADVEIGRGFNGELQQLLVLPDNEERQQCSNKRTSINEVKRYIIDTFISDYGN